MSTDGWETRPLGNAICSSSACSRDPCNMCVTSITPVVRPLGNKRIIRPHRGITEHRLSVFFSLVCLHGVIPGKRLNFRLFAGCRLLQRSRVLQKRYPRAARYAPVPPAPMPVMFTLLETSRWLCFPPAMPSTGIFADRLDHCLFPSGLFGDWYEQSNGGSRPVWSRIRTCNPRIKSAMLYL